MSQLIQLYTRAMPNGRKISIADISTFSWVGCLDWGYQAKDHLDLDEFKNFAAWNERCSEKPASKKGAEVGGF